MPPSRLSVLTCVFPSSIQFYNAPWCLHAVIAVDPFEFLSSLTTSYSSSAMYEHHLVIMRVAYSFQYPLRLRCTFLNPTAHLLLATTYRSRSPPINIPSFLKKDPAFVATNITHDLFYLFVLSPLTRFASSSSLPCCFPTPDLSLSLSSVLVSVS